MNCIELLANTITPSSDEWWPKNNILYVAKIALL